MNVCVYVCVAVFKKKGGEAGLRGKKRRCHGVG